MNRPLRKQLTLQQLLMLRVTVLLMGILILLGAVLIPERLRSYDAALDEQIALVARLVAESGDTKEAVITDSVSMYWVEQLDALAADTEDVDYIVVANADGNRVYHPNHHLIGQHFVGGDEHAALEGQAPYFTTHHGTEVDQRRAFHTVYSEDGIPIGFVMVSASLRTIQQQKVALLRNFLLIFALALVIGLISAWLLARSIRSSLLGHEPSTFAAMYLQRENVLDHLSECLLAVSPDGHLLFANAPGMSANPTITGNLLIHTFHCRLKSHSRKRFWDYDTFVV